ncbi:hypothetical protein HYC85_003207 [Camellia sinensis]|uniref:Rhamnogalacturonan lyase domain-containing protein n=1 Tax=Camellia sinensis TaxID=4442 RepID=A0A7J7ICS4_CAMSI|nr:hypothetical protein HYC85_003207 [Camellia sinensis]
MSPPPTAAGSNIKLNNLVYKAPRAGPTVWEIGIADRVATEFFIPDPNPSLVNHLYNGFDKFRQYGLWNRYTEIYPRQDLVYTVGVSNYKRDWFFAHWVDREDNAIARRGIHGLYRLFSISVPGSELYNGKNTIYLMQSRASSPFQGVMYDYIRLEGPK